MPGLAYDECDVVVGDVGVECFDFSGWVMWAVGEGGEVLDVEA